MSHAPNPCCAAKIFLMTVTWTITTVPHIHVSQNNDSEDNGLATLPERTVSEKKQSHGATLLLDNAGSSQVGSSPHLHKENDEMFRRSFWPYKHVLCEYFSLVQLHFSVRLFPNVTRHAMSIGAVRMSVRCQLRVFVSVLSRAWRQVPQQLPTAQPLHHVSNGCNKESLSSLTLFWPQSRHLCTQQRRQSFY